jgi:hypothetical protein
MVLVIGLLRRASERDWRRVWTHAAKSQLSFPCVAVAIPQGARRPAGETH